MRRMTKGEPEGEPSAVGDWTARSGLALRWWGRLWRGTGMDRGRPTRICQRVGREWVRRSGWGWGTLRVRGFEGSLHPLWRARGGHNPVAVGRDRWARRTRQFTKPERPARRSGPTPTWRFMGGGGLTLLGLGLWALAVLGQGSTNELTDDRRLTVERIFGRNEFKTESWGPARWLADSSGYTTLEKSPTTPGGRDLVRHDLATGSREVLVAATSLIAKEGDPPLGIQDYAWSGDGRKLLVFSNTRRVWRTHTRGDYWVYDRDRATLMKLGGEAEPATLMFATFSPEGDRVAYVREHNLYVQDLATGTVTALTTDGDAETINGTSDWVNEEEFHLRHGFRWSPDGRRIAYWQFDTSGVGEFQLVNYTDGLYPKLKGFKYPKAGETNSACRVGVVSAAGGPTRWFRPNADPRNHYIPELEWAPDSRSVVFQQLNRLQNANSLIRGHAQTGRTQVLLTDRDGAWVDVVEEWHWLAGGRRFLWVSEQDGWRRPYLVSRSGRTTTRLTSSAADILDVVGVDERRGWVYVTASPDDPTQRSLFRVRLDGGGDLDRVTPAGQPGTHAYTLSPDARWAFHTYSRFGQPPVVDLIRLPRHRRVRVLADNSELRAKLDRLDRPGQEFFRVAVGEGVELDGWCLKPPGFDPGRRYPMLVHVYGEPAGQTVLDRWGGDNYLWHCFLAQEGYVVVSVDNRGTPAPRGREWRKCIYRQVGILASADQAAATRRVLSERAYLDPGRVGVWGWSGGGSMTLNALFRYPEVYRMGMAIAFVSDQRYYDTIYQERYMGLPADNEAGFKNGSPITYAQQLTGSLLLVYGTGDDNCHYQNCEALVNELVAHNKAFDQLVYPNRSHSLSEGATTRRHLYEALTRYLRRHLPVEPAGGERDDE